MSKPPITLPDTDDPYVLLDVRPGASHEQLRRAYLRKVKVWKPDRHPAEFRRIREAYDRLREQERWFDLLRQVSEATPTEGAPPDAGDEPGDAAYLEAEAEAQVVDAPSEDEDVEAVIAALELELAEHRERDGDEAAELDAGAGGGEPEPDRRGRAAAAAERLEALEREVQAALEAGRLGDAVDRLLAPGTEVEAAHPGFGPLLLEVCCAAVWELPARYQELVACYVDVVSAHDTEHHDGALLHRRLLEGELPAWREAVAEWPELHRFMVLGASLRAPAEAELGLRLGRRAAADPTGFLRVLARAAEVAPGVVSLYASMAERWARAYDRLPPPRSPRPRPSLEQAAAALADAALHDRRVRWEQARPLLAALALVLVMLLSPTPVVELVAIGALIVVWAWHEWARGPIARIYAAVVRPGAATWLWATRATPQQLAVALRARLPAPGTWGAVLYPGDPAEHSARLHDDLALLAFGATAPMIPRLRMSGLD